MPQTTLDQFRGIAPNRTAFSGRALTAENVDLSGGGIKPIKSSSYVESGHSNEIVYHNGSWVSGNENYLSSELTNLPSLVYKKYGEWKIRIGDSSEEPLWLPKPTEFTIEASTLPTPDAPVVSESGAGLIPAGDYEYFTRFAAFDSSGTELRESLTSAPAQISVTFGRVRAARPLTTGVPRLSKWRLYRRETGGTLARLVGEAGVTEAFIFDDLEELQLGRSVNPITDTILDINYRYVIAWVRNIGGWVHESAPSDPVGFGQATNGVKLTLTSPPPTEVDAWRIYRIDLGFEATTTFQLVAEVDSGTLEYIDAKLNIDLGAALGSSYIADNGALVTAGVPDSQFDGMAGPFSGFYVGWIGKDLYLSESGNPAWWPGAYIVQANHPITSVTQAGSNLAVVTTGGVQLGYGTTPEYFVLGQRVQGSGGVGRNNSDEGYYLGYNGISSVLETGVELVSKDFSKDYFDAIDHTTSYMIQEKERLFLFHSDGALVFDFVTRQWTTLSNDQYAFTSVYKEGGEVYGLRNGIIVKLFGSDDDASWIYKGALDFGEAASKRVESIYFFGSGICNVDMSTAEDIDTIDSSGEVDMSSGYEPDRVVSPPATISTEATIFRMSGNSTIRSILPVLHKTNSES